MWHEDVVDERMLDRPMIKRNHETLRMSFDT